jgi:alkanesulfonate monooxygenase SsuD/methylene tetrahydromethanopterin reductase-like flavin-dependent oxidoreductase (luciferase family)
VKQAGAACVEENMDDKIRQAAEAFGKALAEIPAAVTYHEIAGEMEGDGEALRLKALLEMTYDELIQRQATGEVTRGEIEAYYELEQRVRANPLLASHDARLEQVKDTFSEANELLSARLGFDFMDLVG